MNWRQIKRVLLFVVAMFFFALGVIGLILPFVPQFIFFAVAAILLSILSTSIRTWIDKHTVKYPKFHAFYLKIDTWLRKVIGEV